MQQILKALIVTLGVVICASASADAKKTPLESLRPTAEHRQATEVIVHLMQRYHYSRVSVNNELSEQIFDRYLESLDPQKHFFLASDIKEFNQYRKQFDNFLKRSKLTPVFDIFKRFRMRVEERALYANTLLENDFDFTVDETYKFDREDAQWPESQQAADEIWRKRVKNDVLSLRLADQSDSDLLETLENRYERMQTRISQLSPNDVFQIFINSYTLSVEPHTSYFSPRSSENFKINMSLSLEGIGAALSTEGEYTVVQRIIAGGPAALSEAIVADDRIVGVGDGNKSDDDITDVVSWPLGDVVDLIRGPKGSKVKLKVLPASAPAGSPPKIISLIRDKINLEQQAAKKSVIEVGDAGNTERFGVIDLPTFYLDSAGMAQGLSDFRSTTRDVKRLIEELTTSEEGVDGIIIDLRGNGGGSLIEATSLTGLFIKTGPVVQIKGADGDVKSEVDQDPSIAYEGPLAVLVDRNSASASEIFAAAIQDYGRGVIVGEPTFGKGTVQTVAPLDRDGKLGQLKITMAQFFRINGDGTQHRGVVPDVLFPTALDSDAQGERGLDNALAWGEVADADYDAWQAGTADFSQLKARHEARYQSDDTFDVLIKELQNQRKAREESYVSLVESERRQEIADQGEDRAKRQELVRAAFGATNSDEEDDESGVIDILLLEAANVLNDSIDFPPRN